MVNREDKKQGNELEKTEENLIFEKKNEMKMKNRYVNKTSYQ